MADEIKRLRKALLEYDRVLPYLEGAFRELFHRDLDLATLGYYQRCLVFAAGSGSGTHQPF
jgi:hypothetical protein